MRKPRPSSQSLTPIPPAATIFAIHDTLHLLFHHNKNQHRGAKWFKWLGLLKRWVHKLAVEVETAQSQVRLELAIEDDEAQGIREIMLHLGRDLVPRCYGYVHPRCQILSVS